MMTSTQKRDYAASLGQRLRRVRAQQKLSLNDVERRSDGSFKASVLGAYERGERTMSVARLRRLAEFYRVPLSELMPEHEGSAQHPPLGGVRVHLTRLEATQLPEAGAIQRFISGIASRRGDYNGSVITIRRDDLRALAAVLDVPPGVLRERLTDAGVVDAVPVEPPLPR